MQRESQDNVTRGQQVQIITKVVILAYYRSGSSFLGSILENCKESFYIFEPIRPLAGHRYGNGGLEYIYFFILMAVLGLLTSSVFCSTFVNISFMHYVSIFFKR